MQDVPVTAASLTVAGPPRTTTVLDRSRSISCRVAAGMQLGVTAVRCLACAGNARSSDRGNDRVHPA